MIIEASRLASTAAFEHNTTPIGSHCLEHNHCGPVRRRIAVQNGHREKATCRVDSCYYICCSSKPAVVSTLQPHSHSTRLITGTIERFFGARARMRQIVTPDSLPHDTHSGIWSEKTNQAYPQDHSALLLIFNALSHPMSLLEFLLVKCR